MKYSNAELLSSLKTLRASERELLSELLEYLVEVEERGLHLERGFSSMYSFCMSELGYSEDEAYVRIQGMRLFRLLPSFRGQLQRGTISLSVAAKAQTVFRRKEKQLEGLDVREKIAVLNSLEGLSKREAERKLANQFPEVNYPIEKMQPISGDRTRYEFTVSRRVEEKLERLRCLLAHKNFDGRMENLIEEMADIALQKLDLVASGDATHASPDVAERPVPEQVKRTRYIPKSIRRMVWEKANSQCEYVNSETQRRCECRYGLQIDHIDEFSRGGGNDLENLQLLCGAHNRWRSGIRGTGS